MTRQRERHTAKFDCSKVFLAISHEAVILYCTVLSCKQMRQGRVDSNSADRLHCESTHACLCWACLLPAIAAPSPRAVFTILFHGILKRSNSTGRCRIGLFCRARRGLATLCMWRRSARKQSSVQPCLRVAVALFHTHCLSLLFF